MAGPNGRPVTVVSVKKCRYLEATRCSGVCVNMCKLPAQDVVRSEFGVPLYVAPNHADGSCRMFFGQEPLPEQIDPALSKVPVAVRDRGDEHAAAPAAAGAADRHGRVAGGGGVDGGFGGEVLRLASAAASPEVPGAAEEGPGHLTTNASSVV